MSGRVVVLGAGYSGLIAAKLLARRSGVRVTLVNARERFVERVRLHQLATGQRMRDLPITGLLAGTGVEFVADTVTAIDAAARTVTLGRDGRTIGYDTLVYALGSRADLGSVPGVAEHAYTVAGAEQARRLGERLRTGGSVSVVGGGLTGIEAAAELAESHPDCRVRLVTGGELGAALSARGRAHLRRAFTRLGVEILEDTVVTEVTADALNLDDGRKITTDTVVWTTGFDVSPLAREAGLAVDAHGRMVVDATLRSVSHPEVYAVGDAAAARRPDGQELRMACATGIPAAYCAARSILARRAGATPKPLGFRYLNQCISLGRRDALVQFVRADDTPVEAILTGRTAALYKETIVRSTILAERHPLLAAFG
jgi:NADH dehydrogenase FAD-containing subunit